MSAAAVRQKDTTLRVHAEAYEKLRAAARLQHKPLTQYMDELAEREWRRSRLEACNAAFARLRSAPAAWAAYQAERREFEGTLGDGLDDSDERDYADEGQWEFVEPAAG